MRFSQNYVFQNDTKNVLKTSRWIGLGFFSIYSA